MWTNSISFSLLASVLVLVWLVKQHLRLLSSDLGPPDPTSSTLVSPSPCISCLFFHRRRKLNPSCIFFYYSDYGNRYRGGGGGGYGGGQFEAGGAGEPRQGPFIAFVGNLPQGIVQGDIDRLFDGLKVKILLFYHLLRNEYSPLVPTVGKLHMTKN